MAAAQPLQSPQSDVLVGRMKEIESRLTLGHPATYQIKVPGEFDARWADWAGGLTVDVEGAGAGRSVTTLTGRMDQAALHGLLRRLYSLGLPLISVVLVAREPAEPEADGETASQRMEPNA